MDSFIIKKPWVTEKATSLGAHRQYVFLVEKIGDEARNQEGDQGTL